MKRIGDRDAVDHDPDDQPDQDVDRGDHQSGDGIALHEFGGTVHRAIEAAFGLDLGPPFAGLNLGDHPGRQIGVDRHLLARHRVQAEARGNFGDAARTLGDDDEVDHHQDRENRQADDGLTTHQEFAERADHAAGRLRPLMPVRQDQPRRGKVEAEPQHRRDQQDRRESRELERLFDK